MAYWDGPVEAYTPEYRAFARMWQTAQKIVFSRTLTDVATGNTHLERDFDFEAIRKFKRGSEHDIFVAELAGLVLVDECPCSSTR